ncbi:MAG: alpha/beta fold hydrolase [Acidobacteriales bacterium]|nr:alpha/beta fold hydrolase [Terriglobales bacterium]
MGKQDNRVRYILTLFALLLCACLPGAAQPTPASNSISAHDADVDGLKLHYLTAGHGPAVLLLHGYTQTSRMWRPLMPSLAENFTVIAPDLPGIGDSGIPASGLDMKSAAVSVHALVKSLGINKARVVGHDIGLWSLTPTLRSILQKQKNWLCWMRFCPALPDGKMSTTIRTSGIFAFMAIRRSN